jgi:hypothetical protein
MITLIIILVFKKNVNIFRKLAQIDKIVIIILTPVKKLSKEYLLCSYDDVHNYHLIPFEIRSRDQSVSTSGDSTFKPLKI